MEQATSKYEHGSFKTLVLLHYTAHKFSGALSLVLVTKTS